MESGVNNDSTSSAERGGCVGQGLGGGGQGLGGGARSGGIPMLPSEAPHQPQTVCFVPPQEAAAGGRVSRGRPRLASHTSLTTKR
jgi:hypothetical protein